MLLAYRLDAYGTAIVPGLLVCGPVGTPDHPTSVLQLAPCTADKCPLMQHAILVRLAPEDPLLDAHPKVGPRPHQSTC